MNVVSPGYVATDMLRAVSSEIQEKLVAGIPLGRLGEPAEIAHAVDFLASCNAGYITGATLSVNGGMRM